ncbi:Chitinase domain-containing protein 1 [Hordeum vulgare]|nr:Chitinase domain-containing protein 1 [Hordeum vulgare]
MCLSLFLQPINMNSDNKLNLDPVPIPNSFPWGIGWRALFLGCSLDDHTKFDNTMELCSNFSNMEELHKESDAMMKKAMPEELKTLIPDPAKRDMSVDILRWAMNQVDSNDAGHRAKWAKYRQYWCPHDHCASVYFTTNIVVVPLEEDQEPVAMVVEEDGMRMIARAPMPGQKPDHQAELWRGRRYEQDQDQGQAQGQDHPPRQPSSGSPRIRSVCKQSGSGISLFTTTHDNVMIPRFPIPLFRIEPKLKLNAK